MEDSGHKRDDNDDTSTNNRGIPLKKEGTNLVDFVDDTSSSLTGDTRSNEEALHLSGPGDDELSEKLQDKKAEEETKNDVASKTTEAATLEKAVVDDSDDDRDDEDNRGIIALKQDEANLKNSGENTNYSPVVGESLLAQESLPMIQPTGDGLLEKHHKTEFTEEANINCASKTTTMAAAPDEVLGEDSFNRNDDNTNTNKGIIGRKRDGTSLIDSDDGSDNSLIGDNPSNEESLHMSRPTDEELLEKQQEKNAREQATALDSEEDKKPKARDQPKTLNHTEGASSEGPRRRSRGLRRTEEEFQAKMASKPPGPTMCMSEERNHTSSRIDELGAEPNGLVSLGTMARAREVADGATSLPQDPTKEVPPPTAPRIGAVPVQGFPGQHPLVQYSTQTDSTSQGLNGNRPRDETNNANIQNNNNTLVVAELATDQTENLLRAQEENESLRRELQRISDTAVSARSVRAVRSSSNMLSTYREEDTAPFEIEATHRNTTQEVNNVMRQKRNAVIVLMIALLMVVMAVAVPLSVAKKGEEDQPVVNTSTDLTNSSFLPVLEAIHANGVIRCRADSSETDRGEGFTVDLCRALAAAVLGNATKAVFSRIPFRDQFHALTMGELDISTDMNTITMARDVYHEETGYGYTFSDPFYYTGDTFAGIPEFVDCVDRGESFEGICRQLVVCVMKGTVTEDLVNHHFPGSSIHLVADGNERAQAFADGICNVMAGTNDFIHQQRVRDLNFTEDYAFSEKGFWTFEPTAMVTRQTDSQWSDFSNWVLRSLIAAEHLNITQESAYAFPQTKLFGEEYQNMFRRAIAAVGNYGQMYKRHFQEKAPRQGMNLLYRGSPTGLFEPDPFGDLRIHHDLVEMHSVAMPGPIPNGTFEAVKRRGRLRCGLSEERLGFAQYDADSISWSGLDVEFCKAVSASVFAGQVDNVIYVNFEGAGLKQVTGLANGSVDVLAGGIVSMRSDVSEPTTGDGYSFSAPYFFEEGGARRALMTRQDDPQWSDLVRWVSQAIIYAEKYGITQQNASGVPIVELFGPQYRQMLQDVVGATGNYGEVYHRSLEPHIPRHGRNTLNSGNDPLHFPYSFED